MAGPENIIVSLIMVLTPCVGFSRPVVADPTDVDCGSNIWQAPAMSSWPEFFWNDWVKKVVQWHVSTRSKFRYQGLRADKLDLRSRRMRGQAYYWLSTGAATIPTSLARQYAICVDERLLPETRKRLLNRSTAADRAAWKFYDLLRKSGVSPANWGNSSHFRPWRARSALRKSARSGNIRSQA